MIVSNVLNDEKKQQVLALGRLGWSLRRIQRTIGVRRETASGYLKEAGIVLRPPGNWGRAAPAKPAIEVITDSGGGNPFPASDDDPACAKPANVVTTDFGAELAAIALTAPEPKPGRSPSASACAPYLDTIEAGLSRGRNAMAIWQNLVDVCGFNAGYQSVRRFVRNLQGVPSPEACAVIETAAGEEAQVDYGEGPMVRDPHTGKYRRTRLFVLTLGCSRKSVRLLVFRSSSQTWAELHEKAFRRLGGATRVVVLDNLREGVLTPDIYDPTLNPLYRDVLAHYGAVALPCRVRHPDRKGKVESGVGHAKKTPLKGCASKACRKPKPTWTIGKSVGPTLASTAPPSGRSRPCSPKSGQLCCLCLWNPSATTSTASERCIWMAAWKSRPRTTVRRRVGSAGASRCSGMSGTFVC